MSQNIVIIGAGVLSTTFGSMIKELEPNWNIKLYERLDRPGIESSNERNNAGTGHAALCELNYTVQQPDGSIDIEKRKKSMNNLRFLSNSGTPCEKWQH